MRQDRSVLVRGSVDRRFEPAREAFAAVLQEQQGTGASVAAWCDGSWVVDLWGGRADPAGTRVWQPDSLVQPYSVSKPFAAVCALLLVQQGRLDLDAPMQRYWPAFQARADVRQVLSHQAGVVALDEPAPTEVFYDWDRLCALLADQQPAWEPGTAHGESALFYGHLVGELVRRVDGRSLGRFLREEVCGPLGLDFAIGLTETEQARVVDLTGLDEEFRTANLEGRPELYRRAIANPPGALDPAVVNSRTWRAAQVPAINGHGTARGVAGLYAALLQGELLSRTLLAEATTVHRSGVDAVFGGDNAWGLGFGIRSGRVRHGRPRRQRRLGQQRRRVRLRVRHRHGWHPPASPRHRERTAVLPRSATHHPLRGGVVDAVVAAVVSAITAVAVTFISVQLSGRQQRRGEERAERREVNARYLNPLRLHLVENHFRLSEILRRADPGDGRVRDLLVVQEPAEISAKDAAWFNGVGCYLVSSS